MCLQGTRFYLELCDIHRIMVEISCNLSTEESAFFFLFLMAFLSDWISEGKCISSIGRNDKVGCNDTMRT